MGIFWRTISADSKKLNDQHHTPILLNICTVVITCDQINCLAHVIMLKRIVAKKMRTKRNTFEIYLFVFHSITEPCTNVGGGGGGGQDTEAMH